MMKSDTTAAACVGKERFATMSLAQKVADRPRRGAYTLKAYRCTACKGFHLGNPMLREPNGRHSRKTENVMARRQQEAEMTAEDAKSVVIEARVRHGIPREYADLQDAGRPNAGTIHGMMRINGMQDRNDPTGLTDDQFAAAEWFLGKRLAYLRAIGAPGRPHEPSEASGTGGVSIAEANAEWAKVMRVLQDVTTEHRAPVIAAFDAILVRQSFVPSLVGDLRLGLNAIHRTFLAGQRRAA